MEVRLIYSIFCFIRLLRIRYAHLRCVRSPSAVCHLLSSVRSGSRSAADRMPRSAPLPLAFGPGRAGSGRSVAGISPRADEFAQQPLLLLKGHRDLRRRRESTPRLANCGARACCPVKNPPQTTTETAANPAQAAGCGQSKAESRALRLASTARRERRPEAKNWLRRTGSLPAAARICSRHSRGTGRNGCRPRCFSKVVRFHARTPHRSQVVVCPFILVLHRGDAAARGVCLSHSDNGWQRCSGG